MPQDMSEGNIMTPERAKAEQASGPHAEAPRAPYTGPLPERTGPVYVPPPQYPPYPPYQYPYPPRRPTNRNWIGWVIGGILALLVLGGLVVALIAGLFAWAVSGARSYSDTATRTFQVTGAPTIDLRNTAGNVTIQRGSDGQVVVQVTKHVRTLNESVARRELNALTVSTTQSGNAVSITTSFGANFFDGVASTRSVDLVVTVPERATVTGHLNAGNMTLSGISGTQQLDTNAGNITVTDAVFAGSTRLSTNAGNITVSATVQPGTTLDVQTNAGNVDLRLPANTPARLDARVDVGNVSINGWPITVSRSNMVGATASGDLGAPATGRVHVQVNTGNFTLTAR